MEGAPGIRRAAQVRRSSVNALEWILTSLEVGVRRVLAQRRPHTD